MAKKWVSTENQLDQCESVFTAPLTRVAGDARFYGQPRSPGSVTAPSEADDTDAAYFAITPVR